MCPSGSELVEQPGAALRHDAQSDTSRGRSTVSGSPISKIGDGTVRSALYEAAQHHPDQAGRRVTGALKRWALAIVKRAGKKKAKVALARKLAVILHRMWMDWTPFDPTKAVGAAAA